MGDRAEGEDGKIDTEQGRGQTQHGRSDAPPAPSDRMTGNSSYSSEQQIFGVLAAAKDPAGLMKSDKPSVNRFAQVVLDTISIVNQLIADIESNEEALNAATFPAWIQARSPMLDFCTTALPIVVECSLRRKCPREHAPKVASLVIQTSTLLAKLIAFDRSFPQAMQLLYLIFDGTNAAGTFVHVAVPVATSATSSSASAYPVLTFYTQHGRPHITYKDGFPVYFWPDEEQQHLGKELAIGHHMFFFDERRDVWLEGDISAYDETTDKHTVHVTQAGAPETGG